MNIVMLKLVLFFTFCFCHCLAISNMLLQADSGREEVLEQEGAAAGGAVG